MKQIRPVAATAAFIWFGVACLSPAVAVPPTVTPSPGYDARLAEQRATANAAPAQLHRHKPSWRRGARRIDHDY
jgi:hypothetical protein